LLLALVSLVAGCGGGGLDDLLTFGVPLEIEDQTIQGYVPDPLQVTCNPNAQGAGNLGPDTITPISFSLRDSEELRGQSIIRFARVELERVTLRILIPPSQAGQTWDFVDSISIFADDPATPEPPVLVGQARPGAAEPDHDGNPWDRGRHQRHRLAGPIYGLRHGYRPAAVRRRAFQRRSRLHRYALLAG
jgi:hypothetical protein